jgi:hypothetical protein
LQHAVTKQVERTNYPYEDERNNSRSECRLHVGANLLENFMNKFNRKAPSIAGLFAVAVLGTLSANASQIVPTANTSCRQETRRVAVWPVAGNPKLQQIPRFETRTLTVCNHEKTMSKPA